MNEKEARELAIDFLSNRIGLVLCKEIPDGLYNFNSTDNYLFTFDLISQPHVGGTNYLSVSKTTGEVRFFENVGE
jgi:hypothetical protein